MICWTRPHYKFGRFDCAVARKQAGVTAEGGRQQRITQPLRAKPGTQMCGGAGMTARSGMQRRRGRQKRHRAIAARGEAGVIAQRHKWRSCNFSCRPRCHETQFGLGTLSLDSVLWQLPDHCPKSSWKLCSIHSESFWHSFRDILRHSKSIGTCQVWRLEMFGNARNSLRMHLGCVSRHVLEFSKKMSLGFSR